MILKIGNRKSNHYSRVYAGRNSLKFKYEMKGKFLRKYHSLLIENNLEELENKLSKRFLYNFGKILPLQYSYLDWLIVKLRPIKKQLLYSSSLQTHYLGLMDFTLEINRNSWIAKVWIAEELFYYNHAFLFPYLVQGKPTKHEFEILFKIIHQH